MATFRETMKDCLFGYPTIFPNPLDVCVHLFAVVGNGYDWQDGELVSATKEPLHTRMKYPTEPRHAISDCPEDLVRTTGGILKDRAELLQMEFVEVHIVDILAAMPTNVYFGTDIRESYVTKFMCAKYAHAFDFPDDIKKDWAEALYQFLGYWRQQLHRVYGSSDLVPNDVQETREAIHNALVRLHPLLRNGETYEDHVASVRKMLDKIFNDRKQDKS